MNRALKDARRSAYLALVPAALLVAACGGPEPDALVVYSARNEQLIQPIFEQYTERTGVPVRYVTDDAGPLIERLAAEGESTPADLLLTVDAGELWHAAERGLLAPVESPVLYERIPAHLRDPQGRWFGLSVRARTIVYSTERVDPAELGSYADLADPKWQGRLCLRTSKKVYNQSLVAMLIAEYGEPETEAIVRGWVENLATDVFSNDTLLLQAIAAGQCDVGIVNTYYLGRLQRDAPQTPVAPFWADQASLGVHVNVSGAGVTRHAPRPQAAIEFLEWLSAPQAQALFAGLNFEYPANPGVEVDPLVASWGTYRQSTFNLSQAGALQSAAVRLMDRAGYR
jgi:iron(III) transport system substrate-binding protein